MTTIAVNKYMMAADSQCSHDGMRTTANKIIKVDGDIIGIAGSLEDLYRFGKWYRTKTDDLDLDDSNIIVLTKNNKIFTYEGHTRIPVKEGFYALGTGAFAAMAAMHMGADPRKAVEIARKVDVNTGGPIAVKKV